ncbi:MAG TPA: histidine kinase [Gemmatimonadales bacterium]|nr:histidine kinase [Gemmatimonadales bacterium]
MTFDAAGGASPRLRRLVLLVSALCVLFGGVELLQQHVGNSLRGVPSEPRALALTYWVPWLVLLPLLPGVVFLAERLPLDRGRWRGALAPHLAAMLAFSVLHQLGAALVMTPGIAPPPPSFAFLFGKLLTFRFAIDALIYWGTVGATQAVRASQEAREREQAAARLEATLAEARLAALRGQLNPHFLFNTLNAVTTLALRGDHQGVVRVLGALGELLRLSLDGRRGQEIPLAEELAFLELYFDIQEIRFGGRLTIDRRIEDDALAAAVPTMLLQPILENAFQHGASRTPGPVRIELRAWRDGATLRLEVRDTGPGFGGVPPREGIGLGNTRARLHQLYGPAYALRFADAPGGGAVVSIGLPYRPLRLVTPATTAGAV